LVALTLIVGWSYIALVIWTIVQSAKRWSTVLWLLIGWVAPLPLMLLAGIIWQKYSGQLGSLAALLSVVCSGCFGVIFTVKHRRPSKAISVPE
jgi:hypothetical protein